MIDEALIRPGRLEVQMEIGERYSSLCLNVAKTYYIQSIILYFGKVKELYFICTLFQSNTLQIL